MRLDFGRKVTVVTRACEALVEALEANLVAARLIRVIDITPISDDLPSLGLHNFHRL